MTYKELLALYRTGKLDKSARQMLEAEIEKQDAISEYLCEAGEVPGLDELPDLAGELPGEDDRLTAAIRRSIRRSFLRMGSLICAAAVVIVLCCLFVLPKAVDRFYYDPTEAAGRDDEAHSLVTSRLELDLAVWSELFLPGHFRNSASVQSEGYGVYTVALPQSSSPDGRTSTVNGCLVRGQLTLYDTDPFRLPAANEFFLPDDLPQHFHTMEEGVYVPPSVLAQRTLDRLDDLLDNTWYLAYVSLREITGYEDFYAWYDQQDLSDGGNPWCAVYTEDEAGYLAIGNAGMLFSPSGLCLDWDREAYPFLSLLDNRGSTEADTASGEDMAVHFTSLLRYLADHPELGELFSPPFTGKGTFNTDQAIRYVEENGLEVYGFAALLQKDDLLRLRESGAVSGIRATAY